MTDSFNGPRLAAAALFAGLALSAFAQAPTRQAVRNGDYIVAVVNQELVTAGEIDQRLDRAREAATKAKQTLPPETDLRKRILDALIEERVIITYARDGGMKVDEPELDRAVQNVATQNQLSVEQLRSRLKDEGIDYPRFRANLRDQMLVERIREREVYQRIRITDAEIDKLVDRQRADAQADAEINLAQILVTVPDGASEAIVTARRASIETALQRLRAGEAFATVVRDLSEDGNREKGGEIGMRPASRLPDAFVDAVRNLKVGEYTPAALRSGAGFHLLKVLDRREAPAMRVTQTRARHILLRTSERLTAEVAARRLLEYRRQIEARTRSFEDVAKQYSEDGTAASGGELGWAQPGQYVPEFEEAMNKLDINGLSQPVVSRFGVHLIQVMERRDVAVETKALREQARGVLREQKFDDAYAEWAKDLKSRAYIEMREPPL
jgi:peptidyl-prolyl cis-trans isomerase SurA